MPYKHTQRAPLHCIFYPVIIALLVLAWTGRDRPPIVMVTLGVAATLGNSALLSSGGLRIFTWMRG